MNRLSARRMRELTRKDESLARLYGNVITRGIFLFLFLISIVLVVLCVLVAAGLNLIASLGALGSLFAVLTPTLGTAVTYVLYGVKTRKDARYNLKNELQTLEQSLESAAEVEPVYLRYPSPFWVDFKDHVYRRKEVEDLIELLKDENTDTGDWSIGVRKNSASSDSWLRARK